MRIGIIGSMQYTEKMMAIRDQLISMGHDAYLTSFAPDFVGKSDSEKEAIKLAQKSYADPLTEFWQLMQGGDAVLVLNLDKHGIKNYIGGNTLMEIGFAHVLKQKVFLWNEIPEIPYYKTEIISVNPIVINQDLNNINN